MKLEQIWDEFRARSDLFPMVVSERHWALICWDHRQIGAISSYIFHLFASFLKPWNVWKFLAARPIRAQALGVEACQWPHVALIVENDLLLHPIIAFTCFLQSAEANAKASQRKSKGNRLIPADNSCPMELRSGQMWQMWRRTCVWFGKISKNVVCEGIRVKFFFLDVFTYNTETPFIFF